jgi:hypothetical protein
MATLDNEDLVTDVSATDTISHSFAIGSGSNRRLFVWITAEESGTPVIAGSTVTYNSTSLSQVTTATAGTGSFKNLVEVWELLETDLPTTGTYTVTATLNRAADYLGMHIIALEDADQSAISASQHDKVEAESVTANTFATGASVANGDYTMHMTSSSNGSRTFTSSGTYSELADVNMGGASYCMYGKAITGSGTETPTVTASGSNTRLCSLMLNALTVAAGGVTVNAVTDTLAITEQAANVNAQINVAAVTANLAITEQAANVNAQINVTTTVDTLAITEQAADVNLNVSVTTVTDALAITEQAASVAVSTGVNAVVVPLTINEQSATVQVTGALIAQMSIYSHEKVIRLYSHEKRLVVHG